MLVLSAGDKAGDDSVTRMNAPERLTAWIYTGPLGHLYGTLADITTLWVRWGASELRLRRGGRPDHG